jgi:dihydroorotate dehydrogenase electron transfer subunit
MKWMEQALIVTNQALSADVYRMVVHSPQVAAACVPGQFVMVRLPVSSDPLLRRPLSIAGADREAGTLTLIYRLVGRGTQQMAAASVGATLDVMGPLGRGFDLSASRLLLVGGGIGLAPLLFAAQRCCPAPVEVLAGGRTKDELFWTDLFRQLCKQIHVTTDDGSLGLCGTCADALPELLMNGKYEGLLTCGPRPMMRRVAALATATGVRTQVSLEEHMACGLGACLSCTCAAADGASRQVCKDGPVFWSEEVDWS